MKYLLVITFLFIIFGCTRTRPLDPLFQWPATNVAEADSLILQYERNRVSVEKLYDNRDIVERFCSVARRHPDNKLLQMRSLYLQACTISYKEKDAMRNFIENAMLRSDSALSPYDWHAMKGLKAEFTHDLYERYFMSLDNIKYFSGIGAKPELSRNLIIVGNILSDLHDTVKAMEYYKGAEKISTELNLIPHLTIARLNMANVSKNPERINILKSLLSDTMVNKDHHGMPMILQNTFAETGEIGFLDRAIEMLREREVDNDNLSLCLGLKGRHMAGQGDLQEGKLLLRSALDTMINKQGENRYTLALHRMMAEVYYLDGKIDSCLDEVDRAYFLRDSLDRVMNKPQIYAMDAKSRIEMAERTARLEKTRIVMLCVVIILLLALILGYSIFRNKRKQEKQRFEKKLLEEKMDNERQAMRAQAKVMEENERMVNDMETLLTDLKARQLLPDEGADELRQVLRIYKSNEENRKGFLKVNEEIDATFMTRLKNDFPSLNEYYVKLASLVAAGIDNRQIATILNTEMPSVYKARYRLRTRLGLSKEQSLEEFLRRYNLRNFEQSV